MDVRESWDLLNQRIKKENETMIPNLFRIHMGAFEDLRNSGHLVDVNGQPVNILAAKLKPEDRFSLACQIGRKLIDAKPEMLDDGLVEHFTIQKANFFPNCIAIALAAILEKTGPGFPGMKMTVICSYDTIKGEEDLFGKALSVLEPCFPRTVFQVKATETGRPEQKNARLIPIHGMQTLFQADGLTKTDTARTSFSGKVIRGEIRKGDVLNVTTSTGREICPPGVVLAIFLKDRVEDGKVVGEQCEVLSKDQHADSLLVAVEIPKGDYDGIVLSGREGAEQTEKPAGAGPNKEFRSPASGEDRTAGASRPGFFSRLFGKR